MFPLFQIKILFKFHREKLIFLLFFIKTLFYNFLEMKRVESGEETNNEGMDRYNNNTLETKGVGDSRKPNYMRQYQREVEPCTKLSEKVMIPIKKYPKVFVV